MKTATFEVSLPPSDAARQLAWLRGAGAEIEAQVGDVRISGCVRVNLVAGLVDSARSLVGVTELVTQLLGARIIDGAHCITDVALRWDKTCEFGPHAYHRLPGASSGASRRSRPPRPHLECCPLALGPGAREGRRRLAPHLPRHRRRPEVPIG